MLFVYISHTKSWIRSCMAHRSPKRSEAARRARGNPASGRRGAYEAIKDDVLSLALQPGQDLDEVSLSRRYGVSRTPVREALIRLASERLVSFGQNRRARVTALILADYPRFMEALDLARRAVSRLAALRRHETDLAKIRAAEKAFAKAALGAREANDPFARMIAPLDAALQLAVAEASHNSYLTRTCDQLLTVGHRMLHLPYAYDPHSGEPIKAFVERLVARHSGLASAIEAGDADGAEAEARALHGELTRRLRSYLEENLTASVRIDVESADGPDRATTARALTGPSGRSKHN
ncbi:MAG: GntR family transcriptional regulator [Hyphomicrobiaceae bacterium]|nr:MAG: GntR family transcriptional regulator [Hyphomicrobiaceae bacterium]